MRPRSSRRSSRNADRADASSRRSSASARPGSISITSTARASNRPRSSAAHAAAARATGLPIIVHTRDADRRDHRDSSKKRKAASRRHPLLLVRTGIGRERARARLLHLVLGHRDLQERPRSCATSSATCRSSGCWWRPTRRISRRCRCAARRNEPAYRRPYRGAGGRTRRRSAGRAWPRDDARISSAVRQGARQCAAALRRRVKPSPCWAAARLLGRAAGRGNWGACDPNEPRNRRRRVSVLVEESGRPS